MKNTKRLLITLLLAVIPMMASAQILEKAAQRSEIATVETELEDVPTTELQVFRMDNDGTYWLSVGHLGVGIDIIQIQFDPVYELFIPLGNTLDEALETLSDLQAFYKKPKQSAMEVQGCLAAIVPNDNLEPVTVTSRRLLGTKILSFSVKVPIRKPFSSTNPFAFSSSVCTVTSPEWSCICSVSRNFLRKDSKFSVFIPASVMMSRSLKML